MGDGRVGPGEQPQAEHHIVHRTLIQGSSLGTSQLAPVPSFRVQERRGELGDEKRERETNSETGRPGVYFTPLALLPRDTRKRPGLNHHQEPSLVRQMWKSPPWAMREGRKFVHPIPFLSPQLHIYRSPLIYGSIYLRRSSLTYHLDVKGKNELLIIIKELIMAK